MSETKPLEQTPTTLANSECTSGVRARPFFVRWVFSVLSVCRSLIDSLMRWLDRIFVITIAVLVAHVVTPAPAAGYSQPAAAATEQPEAPSTFRMETIR